MGLPGLKKKDRARVEADNEVIEFFGEIGVTCHKKKIADFNENPKNSYYWITPPMKRLK